MKHRLLITAAVLLMLLFTCISANAAEQGKNYKPAPDAYQCGARGDTDADGSVTAADARFALRVAVDLESADAEQLEAADMDSNGTISASDARMILRISVGLSKAPGHKAEEEIVLSEPTCTEDGVTATLCQYCEKLYDYGRTKATGHRSSGWETVKTPDCTHKGLAQQTCVNCGTITETKSLAKLPHQFGKKQYETAPSCMNYVNTYRVCEVCGTTERSAEKPAGSHSWFWETVTEATCTENGLEKEVCLHCGEESGRTQVIKCVGSHDLPSKWSTSVNPTCTEDGLRIKVCRRCKKICEQEIIPASHLEQENSRRTTAPATCTENGAEEYYCLVCRQTVTVTIPAKGHTPAGSR